MECRRALLKWAVEHAGGTKALAARLGLPAWSIDPYLMDDARIPDSMFLKLVDFALETKLASHGLMTNSHR